jgi:hypothetical protein
MSEQSDSPELQAYSSGVLYILSALTPLPDYVDPILDKFVEIIESSSVSICLPTKRPIIANSCFIVVEDSSSRTPSSGHLLLSEPPIFDPRSCFQSHARFVGVPL